jgi:hypothetical protein
MPYCQNCGAQMSGEFCAACGVRAGASQASPPQAAPRKTSPIVWILVAVAGVIVLFGLAVVGGGLFLVHKARQAGLDPELMQNNPGLATAKLLAATNPDLEVVSTDDGHGRITIRQKSTGKTMTVSFDDMKRGRITFREDDKDGGSETMSMGANQAALPAWIPAYPNSKPTSTFSLNGKEGSSASFQFQTQDAAKDVIAFYERGLKQSGFRITMSASATGQEVTSTGGLVSGDDAANKPTVLVTVGADDKGTNVSLTYSQK